MKQLGAQKWYHLDNPPLVYYNAVEFVFLPEAVWPLWACPFSRSQWDWPQKWGLIVLPFDRSPLVFNARTQRSWRRRSWHRPRAPSSPSPSSRRRERLDTIRARITKFGPDVELDERSSHAKFDVSGYFRSPASGHFVNYFSIFSVQYLRNGST